ncbi:Phospholipid-transporting ATPase 2 [Camellia lanceoleosa]|uniref:Phospholipid-transporting ATPase 2 n=1 Tax=Camellia lanceoleosa TaxID=1840588 RepID=A0ACC0H6R3_9ERIC|nr:Phospholipid-transporting ATPase 2 [Camellia lanceoleosa]
MKRKRIDSGSWVISKARIHYRSSTGKIGKRRGSTTFSNFSDEACLDVFLVTVNKEENGREVKARFKRQMSYNDRTFVKPFFMNRVKHGDTTVQAQDIRVGNIVWLRENDEVPCDLVLIGTSDPQGLCYVETSALDGETDLKTRVIPSACVGIDFELLHKIKASFSIRYHD